MRLQYYIPRAFFRGSEVKTGPFIFTKKKHMTRSDILHGNGDENSFASVICRKSTTFGSCATKGRLEKAAINTCLGCFPPAFSKTRKLFAVFPRSGSRILLWKNRFKINKSDLQPLRLHFCCFKRPVPHVPFKACPHRRRIITSAAQPIKTRFSLRSRHRQ